MDAQKPEVMEPMDLELADEQQILAELQGKTLAEADRWVYPIQGGFQLSYKAVKMACRKFAERGEVIEVEFPADVRYDPKDQEYLWVQVKGTRIKIDPKTGHRIVLDSALGSKRKWIKETLKDKSVRADPSYFEKAIAQAERNAKMALLPQDFVKDFTAQILKQQHKVGTLAAQKPPQKAPPEAQTVQKPPETASKPVAGSKPPQAPQKPQEPAKAPTEAPAAPGKPSGELSALHQQFWAVLKSITKSKDEASGRQALKRFTGKEKVSELDEATLRTLGGILRKVSKQEAAIDLDPADKSRSIIVDGPTKDVLWPLVVPPAADPAPAPAEDAPPVGEKWAF